MKRKIKNIIMIMLFIILIGTNSLTIYFASKEVNNQSPMQGENQTPPSMPSGEGNQPGNNNSSTQQNEENNNTNQSEAPNENGNNTPPSKPDGDSSENNPNQNGNKPEAKENNQSTLSVVYLGLFSVQSLAISLIIIYLIMSHFNKKTRKETFSSSDKIIIYLLSVILITSALTFLDNTITTSLKNNHENTNMLPNNGNATNSDITYSGAKEITEDTSIENEEYTSSTKDENTILASGNIKSTISNSKINKTGSSSGGDNTSFYGINSAILAKSGANLTLKNLTITTDATGANGVFSYGGSATTQNQSGDGTTVTISDSNITTKKDNSGGIMTTGGGTTKANNLTVTTSGISSAAIRSDRGGGVVEVDKGAYTTTNQGSPAIYSTANISVSNAKLISKASEGVVIEGKNSVTLNNVTLTDTNNKLNGKSTTYKNIFLYQSMSGDADSGTSKFTSTDSNITTNKGDTIYVTNTKATITLKNNTITNNDQTGAFLRCQKDSWGTSGSNGADVTLNLNQQKVTGNIIIDSISTLKMTMESSSSYTGAINTENTAKNITLKLSKNSKIKLTADSYITSFDNEDTTNANIDFNGHKLYVSGKSIN